MFKLCFLVSTKCTQKEDLLSAFENLMAKVSFFVCSSAKSTADQTHALSLPQFGCKLMSFVTKQRNIQEDNSVIFL